MAASGVLSIVIATNERPAMPAYHAYSTLLAERAATEARAAGWRVELVAAAQSGVVGTLRRTEHSDALVLLGGEDIAPEYYGAARGYRGEGSHLETADEAQLALVRRAAERGVPLLGVCRGHQLINVAFGGTLVQDLGEGSAHRNDGVPVELIMATHDVEVTRGSALAARLGAVASTQSAHHQAIDRLGADLLVAATAADGVIEAIEHRDLPITGVQWHPEDLRAPRGQFAAALASVASPRRTAVAA